MNPHQPAARWPSPLLVRPTAARVLPPTLLAAVVGVGWVGAGDPPERCPCPAGADAVRRHQQAWARHLGRPVAEENAAGMTLVLIPPGEFLMGSTAKQAEAAALLVPHLKERVWPSELDRLNKEEQPRHKVVLSRPLRVGQTEVTIAQFRAFVTAARYETEAERFGGGNSSKRDETDPAKKAATWRSPGYKVTDRSPVTQITLGDMQAFCNWLSERERRTCCYRKAAGGWTRDPAADGYRLPTEAEWEYACRAGTETQYSFGDDVADLAKYAWYNKNADAVGAGAVATKLPNAWGLYDMHGNVWERCDDDHAADWYGRSPAADPAGPTTGGHKVVRGGGWHYFDLHCRSAYRNNYSPLARTGNTGFRVVRAEPQQPPKE